MSLAGRLCREGFVLIGFLLLAVVQTGIDSDLGSRYQVTPDTTDFVWVLNWVSGHLLSSPGQVFEANAFFPSRHAVLFCEPVIGPALLVFPLRALTRNPVLLYNAAVLLSLALASHGVYRLALSFGVARSVALFAGAVTTYSPQQVTHLNHLNLIAITGFPFLILAVRRLLADPGPWPALAAAAAFAFGATTSGYHAFTGAFLGVLIAACEWRALKRPRVLAFGFLSAALALLVTWPYLSAFAEVKSAEQMTRGAATAVHYSVDLVRTFTTTNGRFWREVLPFDLKGAFPGIVVTVLAIAGVARGERRARRLALVIFVTFFTLSLGPMLRLAGRSVGWLPTAVLYEHVPFFDAIRHPNTFLVPAWFGLGLLSALGATALRLPRRPLAWAAIAALGVLESLSVPPPRIARPLPVPPIYAHLAPQPEGAALVLPIDDPQEHIRWWSVFDERPRVNGQGAFEPERYGVLYRAIRRRWSEERAEGLDDELLKPLLVHYPIAYAVVHSWAPAGLRWNLERTPRVFEHIAETGDGDRLYRVHRRGRGAEIRRAYRDDQLREGRLNLELRGPAGGRLVVLLEGLRLAEVPLTGRRQQAIVALPRPARRGMSLFVLRLEGRDGEIELEGISAS